MSGTRSQSTTVATIIPWWYAAMLLTSILLGYLLSRWYSEPMNRLLRERRGSTG
jgi:peptidoglycan/LPS O-acetylase OafA/YrhL